MAEAVRRARVVAWVVVGLMTLRAVLSALLDEAIVGAEVAADTRTRLTVLALATLLVLGGMLALCAWQFGRGANWARLLATVIAAVSVLGGLTGASQDSPAWFIGLNLLIGAVSAYLIALLFRPGSNDWFATRAA